LPNGYRIEWAGEFESLQQAKQRLAIVVPLSLVLILMLLYGLFNSLRDSLLALLGIPFAIAGGVIGLFVTGLDFGISAAIGFVSLFGVSVMNGILVITYYNEVRAEGLAPVDAMVHAATQRMRPMLMTALSACIGLFPAAASTGIGSPVQRPLAVVVVAGVLIGPIMLLVVAPALQLCSSAILHDEPRRRSQGQPHAKPSVSSKENAMSDKRAGLLGVGMETPARALVSRRHFRCARARCPGRICFSVLAHS
jgi:cobalt-zinc-cadmium resistance protein CzcA